MDDLLNTTTKQPDAAVKHGLLLQSLASLSEITTTTDAKDDPLEQFRHAMEQDGVL